MEMETNNIVSQKTKKVKYGNVLFIIIGVILGLHLITLIFPFLWMLLTSFKSRIDYRNSFMGLPKVWVWENYTQIFNILRVEYIKDGVLQVAYVETMLANSLILAIFKPFFGMIGMVLCSYIVAKYNFKGRNFLFNTNVFVMIIPIVGTLANQLTVYKQMGIYNNLINYIILPSQPFGFNFLLLYGVFKVIPDSYAESVKIDGGSHWTIFTRISLPLAMPTLFTLYILSFIGQWNDYNASLLFLPSVPNLAYGLYEFQYNSAKYGASLPQILAAFTVCSIPSVILFVCSQGIITKSLNVGGLKG